MNNFHLSFSLSSDSMLFNSGEHVNNTTASFYQLLNMELLLFNSLKKYNTSTFSGLMVSRDMEQYEMFSKLRAEIY